MSTTTTSGSDDVIAANIERARQLVTENPDGLTGEAAEEFRTIETRIARARETDQRAAAIDASGLAGLLAPTNTGASPEGHQDPEPAPARRVGGLAPMSFAPSDVAQLQRDTLEGRGGSIATRDVTDVPMAAEPYFAPVAPALREPTRIADQLTVQSIEAASATYYTASASADAAASVAEGAEKPESDPGWEAQSAPVVKLAHITDVSTEALSDYAAFEGIVRDEMTRGLVNEENTQLLNGPGTGTDLTGITATSGIQTHTPASTEERFLSILTGITLCRTGASFAEPTGVVVHPADWQAILATQASGSGEMIFTPNPASGQATTIWGVPVTVTTQQTEGTALVGRMADATVFSRMVPTVRVDPFSQSSKNLVRFICEERLALGVIRPASFVLVTYNTA